MYRCRGRRSVPVRAGARMRPTSRIERSNQAQSVWCDQREHRCAAIASILRRWIAGSIHPGPSHHLRAIIHVTAQLSRTTSEMGWQQLRPRDQGSPGFTLSCASRRIRGSGDFPIGEALVTVRAPCLVTSRRCTRRTRVDSESVCATGSCAEL